MRLNRSICALAALLSLNACSGAFERPEVEVESVGIAGLGLTGGTLNVHLRVHNPNQFGFRADRLEYELFLRPAEAEPGDTAWVRLSEGVYDEEIEVGGGRTERVTVPVDFTYAGLGEARRSLIRSGSFRYRAVGSIDVRTSFGRREVPFRKTGSFYMTGLNR